MAFARGMKTHKWAAARPFLTLFLLSLLASPASAQRDRVVIKLASLAPINSEWHYALVEMGEKWRAASGGRVELQIIGGGQGGTEEDILRRMRIGQFHAGTISTAGLQHITTSVAVLGIPMAMEDQAALHRVREAMGPRLEEVFLEEGYVLLHWADLGWVRFFTPEPDPSPEAVTSYTYVLWGEDKLLRLWRQAGFQPGVRMNLPEVAAGLKTGLVDAVNTSPLVVAAYQWFRDLPYIIDVRWAPLCGATLVDRRTWERIPSELRPELLRIARETGEEVQRSLLQWEVEALEAMTAMGVEIITPPPEVMDEWRRLFEGAYGALRGDIIPEDWFDEALEAARGNEGG